MSNIIDLTISSTNQLIANEIENAIGETPNSSCNVIEKNSLTGNAVEWIVLGTVALKALSQILDFVTAQIERNKKIKSVKVGELVIKNPTPEDIKYLKEKYLKEE